MERGKYFCALWAPCHSSKKSVSNRFPRWNSSRFHVVSDDQKLLILMNIKLRQISFCGKLFIIFYSSNVEELCRRPIINCWDGLQFALIMMSLNIPRILDDDFYGITSNSKAILRLISKLTKRQNQQKTLKMDFCF